MKRAMDMTVSIVALVILLPLMLVVAAAILLTMGRPVMFRQLRPGLRAQPFEMLKFRTMTNAVDAVGELQTDGARITRLGAFLRSTSLDELPGLWNVLTGKMSLVGPRPLLMEYIPLYSARQQRRHEVRPGITGWAQVNGRNAIGWNDKFELDIWYVDNSSFRLDLIILWKTLRKVLMRDGINYDGEATMSKFAGNKK